MDEKLERIGKIIADIPGFLVGTASSAYQVEGNNHNDWTLFEKAGKTKSGVECGIACDHYNRYEDDFQTLKDLGYNAHRTGIEWARIYPEEGKINSDEINHYKRFLGKLRELGIRSFVTLHHFTLPVWFAERGGFEKKENLKYWEEYVETVTRELGEYIDVYNTINEPMVYASLSYLYGEFPPGKKSLRSYFKIGNNIMRAHFAAVKIVRKNDPSSDVGLVKNIVHFKAYHTWNPIDHLMRFIFDKAFNINILKSLKTGKLPFTFSKISDADMGDFLGINHYNINLVGLFAPDLMIEHEKGDTNLTLMGWGISPKSMTHAVLLAKKYLECPFYITESGIGTNDDEQRQQYILDYFQAALNTLENGVDLRGFFYWSNMDNFEWADGFGPTFGLIGVDRHTLDREIRESARLLGKIANYCTK
ncbi:MAG: family 1 glycosylhydrolase [Candidatus Heimdallarchaeota archaeon]|nr:family 1 glycosylhydrolase [Candidatus Heimdallarchaeota archaeon]